MTPFETALKPLGLSEGGFVNDPQDKGGATLAGVTQDAYNSFRASKGLTAQAVNLATPDEIRGVYRQYWNMVAAHVETTHPALAVLAFDQTFNTHSAIALKLLQVACQADTKHIDGRLSTALAQLAACKLGEAELVDRYSLLRSGFYVGRENSHFEGGWLARVVTMYLASKTLLA